MVCDRFTYNALQRADYQVHLKNLQIVNGGQTCKTIQQTLHDNSSLCADSAYVMVRIYELPEGSDEVVREITKATNSQTPVDLRDLRSNDEIQKTLALGIGEFGLYVQATPRRVPSRKRCRHKRCRSRSRTRSLARKIASGEVSTPRVIRQIL